MVKVFFTEKENNNITGAAWLSSVRAVKCLVQSFNERNSRSMLVNFFFNIKIPLIDYC
jgi:hypothetical protein